MSLLKLLFADIDDHSSGEVSGTAEHEVSSRATVKVKIVALGL